MFMCNEHIQTYLSSERLQKFKWYLPHTKSPIPFHVNFYESYRLKTACSEITYKYQASIDKVFLQ